MSRLRIRTEYEARQMDTEYQRQRRAAAAKAGKCQTCAVRPARPGRVHCQVCSERNKQRMRARRKAGLERPDPVRRAPTGAWCSECICSGAHRPGCSKRPGLATYAPTWSRA